MPPWSIYGDSQARQRNFYYSLILPFDMSISLKGSVFTRQEAKHTVPATEFLTFHPTFYHGMRWHL